MPSYTTHFGGFMQKLASQKRTGACVNAYLILRHKNEVLLSLRQNTNYYDGYYGLVSGHVEDGEPASEAILREAEEEAGIQGLFCLKPIHVMHRKTDRFNIDIFFECFSWSGAIHNRELDKCSQLEFVPIERLPQNIIPYIAKALTACFSNEFYSEEGWS